MSWFRLECKARHDTKLRRAGPDAAWLWACLGMYAVEQETDGVIPADEVEFVCSWGKSAPLIERLLSVGLLEPFDGGYRIPHFLDYNMSRADSAVLRAKRAAAGRLGAMSRVRQVPSKCQANAEQVLSKTQATHRLGSDRSLRGPVDPAREESTGRSRMVQIARWHRAAMGLYRTDVPEDLAGAGLAEPSVAHLSDAAAEALIVAYVRSDEDWPRKCSWGLRGLNASEATRLAVSMAGADRLPGSSSMISAHVIASLDIQNEGPEDDLDQ